MRLLQSMEINGHTITLEQGNYFYMVSDTVNGEGVSWTYTDNEYEKAESKFYSFEE
jgi:hypothetical protein